MGIGIHSPNIAHFPVSSTIVATTHMFNVFIGERLAIDVTLAQLGFLSNVEQPWRHQIVTLFIDSQVALNALNFPKAQSGQFLIKSITVIIRQLKSRGISCVFQWSPGHSKIPVNTEVDKLAQLATLPSHSEPISLPVQSSSFLQLNQRLTRKV